MADITTTRVEDHTLDTLLNELISGRSVIKSDGDKFEPLNRNSRAALEWFRKNKSIWDVTVHAPMGFSLAV